MIDERKKCPNNPHPHLLQEQWALALLLSKLVGRQGTGSLPSTIATPPPPPKKKKKKKTCRTAGTASLPSTIAPPDHPHLYRKKI